jgi:hypothetical protein
MRYLRITTDRPAFAAEHQSHGIDLCRADTLSIDFIGGYREKLQ